MIIIHSKLNISTRGDQAPECGAIISIVVISISIVIVVISTMMHYALLLVSLCYSYYQYYCY